MTPPDRFSTQVACGLDFVLYVSLGELAELDSLDSP